MNKVILMGRLTREPDIRYANTTEPLCIARYTLAVDRRYKRDGEQSADFISCVAMGNNGEFAEKYLHQGTKILVEGRIQTGSYTNKEGNKVYTMEVYVEKHEFCESKGAAGEGYSRPEPSTSSDGFMNVPDGIDEELPFS